VMVRGADTLAAFDTPLVANRLGKELLDTDIVVLGHVHEDHMAGLHRLMHAEVHVHERDVDAPGRRQIVFAPREIPCGELVSSVRGSTGPCRDEPLPLAFAEPFPLESGGLTPPPPARDPLRFEVWGTAPLSTSGSVGGAHRAQQGTRWILPAP